MSDVAKSLQLTEAHARADLLTIHEYDVKLDLRESETFRSHCTIRFTSGTGSTFLDLLPQTLHHITLDGSELAPELLDAGRYPLDLSQGDHELIVEATMTFRNDGEGLHRSTDPADGETYVYGMNFLDAAKTVYGCFDQPDLKARWTFQVLAPDEWLVRCNAAGQQTTPGHWQFQTSEPLSTYFVTLIAGPFHSVTDHHDGIDLGLFARRSLARELDEQAGDILTITKECFDEYHRLFGIRYAFGKYDQAFVPEFNAGAMENPGLVTFRDPMIFTSAPTRSQLISRAMVISHEMAHQWFGNLVTLAWWDDMWLNESFAEYMGYRVAADVTDYTDAWVEQANNRRVWGLTADSRPTTHPVAGNGSVDAASALQDFDGISYAKGSSLLRQLAARLGDEVFLAGVRLHFERHRFGNASMEDLFSAWEEAGAIGLREWVDSWLRTSGHDRLEVTPDGVRRTSPQPREHTLHLSRWNGTGWSTEGLRVTADLTDVDTTSPVLLDPRDEAWADLPLSPALVEVLPEAMSGLDPLARASVWNAIRMGVFHATLAPVVAVDLLCAGLPTEDQDSAVSSLVRWLGTLLSVVPDPDTAGRAVHAALRERWLSAPAGSGLARAALIGSIGTNADPEELQRWLADGTAADLELRWQVTRRLAVLGAVDSSGIDAHLDSEPSSIAKVEHAWCRAALGTPEAKDWAWQRFTGAVDVPNYELEAAGLGMWRPGQDDVVAAWVDRYFAEVAGTATIRQGWVLATSTVAFFPITSLRDSTAALAEQTLAQGGLDLTVHRKLLDLNDELTRRIRASRL